MATPDTTPSTAATNEPPVEFDFSDPDVLRMCLQMLGDEGSHAEQRHAIEILLKLCRNIMLHPGEEKYVKIRKENKAIHDRLLRFDGAKEFLLAIGWSEIDEMYMFLQDPELSVAISILDEQLNTLPAPQPATTSPVSPAQSPCSSTVWTKEEIDKRDKKLEEDRKKRMEEYKKMKREREEIKKQIKADRKDTNTREVQDSHATHLEFGAHIKKFENKGG